MQQKQPYAVSDACVVTIAALSSLLEDAVMRESLQLASSKGRGATAERGVQPPAAAGTLSQHLSVASLTTALSTLLRRRAAPYPSSLPPAPIAAAPAAASSVVAAAVHVVAHELSVVMAVLRRLASYRLTAASTSSTSQSSAGVDEAVAAAESAAHALYQLLKPEWERLAVGLGLQRLLAEDGGSDDEEGDDDSEDADDDDDSVTEALAGLDVLPQETEALMASLPGVAQNAGPGGSGLCAAALAAASGAGRQSIEATDVR
jgi:hypothetical protein